MENVSASGSATSQKTLHFFQPLLPGFHSHLTIPLAFFSRYLETASKNGTEMVKLRSDASDISWEVKLDGQKLTQGWDTFVTSHDLKVGDVVIFRHDGDLLFHVTCLGPSCCEIQYDGANAAADENDSDSNKNENSTELGESSSAHHDSSLLTVQVTDSNLAKDTLFLPTYFSKPNGLTNQQCEIILLNENKKPWTLHLDHQKTCDRAYIRTGWRTFCYENQKVSNDVLTFKLVQAGTTPTLQLCPCPSSSSTNQYRFLTLTLRSYNIKKCIMCLPMRFVRLNGIQNSRKIILVDRYGIQRETSLTPHEDQRGKMKLGKEWTEFCEANGVNEGDSFKMELIKKDEDTETHLLKFCSKV